MSGEVDSGKMMSHDRSQDFEGGDEGSCGSQDDGESFFTNRSRNDSFSLTVAVQEEQSTQLNAALESQSQKGSLYNDADSDDGSDDCADALDTGATAGSATAAMAQAMAKNGQSDSKHQPSQSESQLYSDDSLDANMGRRRAFSYTSFRGDDDGAAPEDQDEYNSTFKTEILLRRLEERSQRFVERNPTLKEVLQSKMKGLHLPDRWWPRCFECDARFDLKKRRHHCRFCGLLFCTGCAAGKIVLPPKFMYGDTPQLVCTFCKDLCSELSKQPAARQWQSELTESELGVSADFLEFDPDAVLRSVTLADLDSTQNVTARRQSIGMKKKKLLQFFKLADDATLDQIKQRYEEKMLENHPDGQSSPQERASAHKIPLEIIRTNFKDLQALVRSEVELGDGRTSEKGNASACRRCLRRFGLMRRRHHCRCCGQPVCQACSPALIALPQMGYFEPVRHCVPCAENQNRYQVCDSNSEAPARHRQCLIL